MDYFNRALRFFRSNGNLCTTTKSKSHCDVMKNTKDYHNVSSRKDQQEKRISVGNNCKTSGESYNYTQNPRGMQNIENSHYSLKIRKSNNNGSRKDSSLKSVRISCDKAEIIRTPTLYKSESSSYITKTSAQSDYNRSRRYRTLSLNDVKKRLSRKRKVRSKRFDQPLQSAFSIKRQNANIDFTRNNSRHKKNTRRNREIVTLFMTSKTPKGYTPSPHKMVGSKLKTNPHSSKLDSDTSFFQKIANKFFWKRSVCPVCSLVSDYLRTRPNCKTKLCSQHSTRLCRRSSRDDSDKHVSFTSDLPVKDSLLKDETSCSSILIKRKYKKPSKEEKKVHLDVTKFSPKCKGKICPDYLRRLYLIPINHENGSKRNQNTIDENIQVSVTTDTNAITFLSRDKETLSTNRLTPLHLKTVGDEAIHISVTSNSEPKKITLKNTENLGNKLKQLCSQSNSYDKKGVKCFCDVNDIPVKNSPRLTFTKETSCGQLFELYKKQVDSENKHVCVGISPANSYVAETNVHVSVNTSSSLKNTAENKYTICKQVAKAKLCKDTAALTMCPYIDEALNTSSTQLNTYEFINSSHSSCASLKKMTNCAKCSRKRTKNFGPLCPGTASSERIDKKCKSRVSCECYLDKAINTSREQRQPCSPKIRRAVGCCTDAKLCESPLLCQCIEQKTSISRTHIGISASRNSTQVIENDPGTCPKCRKKINLSNQVALRPYTLENTPTCPRSNRSCELENTPICPGANRPCNLKITPTCSGANRPCELENTPIYPGPNRPCNLKITSICPGTKYIYKKKTDEDYPLAIPLASNTVHNMNSILSFFTSHRDSHKQVLRQLLFAIVVMTWCPCIILLCLGWCFSLPFKPSHLLSSENRRHGCHGQCDPRPIGVHSQKYPGSNRFLSLWYSFAQEMKHFSRSIVTTDRRRRNMVHNNNRLFSFRSPYYHDRGRTWRREYTTCRACVKGLSIKSLRKNNHKPGHRVKTFKSSNFNSILNKNISCFSDQKFSNIHRTKSRDKIVGSKSKFWKPLTKFFICPQNKNSGARNIDAMNVTENKQSRAQSNYLSGKLSCKNFQRQILEEEFLPVSQGIHYPHRSRPRMRNTKLIRNNDSEGIRCVKMTRSRSEPKRAPSSTFPTKTYKISATNKCTICNDQINNEQKYSPDTIALTSLHSGDFTLKKVRELNTNIKSSVLCECSEKIKDQNQINTRDGISKQGVKSLNATIDLCKSTNIKSVYEQIPIKLNKSPFTKEITCERIEWSADKITKRIKDAINDKSNKQNATHKVCPCQKNDIVCQCVKSGNICRCYDKISKRDLFNTRGKVPFESSKSSVEKSVLCECPIKIGESPLTKTVSCECVEWSADKITKRNQDATRNEKTKNATNNVCECPKNTIFCQCVRYDSICRCSVKKSVLCECYDKNTQQNQSITRSNNSKQNSTNNAKLQNEYCECFDKFTLFNTESNLCECISDSTKRHKSTHEIQPNKRSRNKLVKSVSCQYFIKSSDKLANHMIPKIVTCQPPCKSRARTIQRRHLPIVTEKFKENFRKIKCKCRLCFRNKKIGRSASTRNKIIQSDFPRINSCSSKQNPRLPNPTPCFQPTFHHPKPQPCSPSPSSQCLKPGPNYPLSNLRPKQTIRSLQSCPNYRPSSYRPQQSSRCYSKPYPLRNKSSQSALCYSPTKPKTIHCMNRGTNIRTYPRKCKRIKKENTFLSLGRITKRCFEFVQDTMVCIIQETKALDQEAWKAEITSCESLYMNTLTDRPLFWVFRYFPKCYPSLIAFRKSCRRYGKCILFCFALCFWSPFVLYCYLCVQSCRIFS